LLLNGSGGEHKPDLIASGPSGWFLIELTFNLGSKAAKLKGYTGIDPRYLGQHGLSAQKSPADVLSSRLTFVDDGPFCQVTVADKLEVTKEDRLANAALRDALVNARGTDLRYLPSIPITLLPEMNSQEIREGLVDIVLQLFAPNSPGLKVIDMVDRGLERLAEVIQPHDKSVLIAKVKDQMKVLVKMLDGYLEEVDGVFRASGAWKAHPKTRQYVIVKLKSWTARPSSLQDWWQGQDAAG